MSKIRLTMVALMAGLFLVLASGSAQAATPTYPVATPTPSRGVLGETESVEPDNAVTPAVASDDNGILPGTGGPALAIVVAGIAFVAVGATFVVASRRRSAH